MRVCAMCVCACVCACACLSLCVRVCGLIERAWTGFGWSAVQVTPLSSATLLVERLHVWYRPAGSMG